MTTIDIPGSPGGLDALAGQLENAANDIDAVRDRVATNGLDGEWSGQAADAFRSTLHRLPGELATVGGAFGEAMGTIRNFAGRLAELQQQAQWYQEKMEESEHDLQAANQRHDEAAMSLRNANRAQAVAADPVSLSAAKQAVDLGESMVRQALADVEDIGGQISQLNSGADSIRREYEEAVRSTCSALDAACPPGESLWSGLRHGFDDMTGGAILLGGAAWRGADRGFRDAEKDVKDVAHFTVHEFDEHWGELRSVLVDVGTGLMIAGVVAGVALLTAVTMGTDIPFLLGAAPLALAAFGAADEGTILEGDDIEATTGNASEREQYGRLLPGDMFNVGLAAFGVLTGGALSDAADVVDVGSATFDLVTSATEDVAGEVDHHLINENMGVPADENEYVEPELIPSFRQYVEPALVQPVRFLLSVPPAELMV
jgi:uncharacterized protein YukE